MNTSDEKVSAQGEGLLLRRSSILAIANAVSAAGQFAIVWYIARTWGVDFLGAYWTVAALAELFRMLFTSTVQPLVMREVARNGKSFGHSLGTAFVGTVAIAALAGGLLAILPGVLNYPPDVTSALLVASVGLIPDALRSVGEGVAIGLERVRWVALVTIGAAILQVVVVGAVLLAGGSLLSIFLATSLVSLLNAGVYLLLLLRWIHPLNLEVGFSSLIEWARLWWPFFWVGAFGIGSRQLDTPLLTQLGGFGATGIYTAALRVMKPLVMLRLPIFQAFFPRFVYLFDLRRENSLRLLQNITRLLSVTLSALALGITGLAGPLVTWLYGSAFEPSARVLQIAVWGLSGFYGQVLISSVLFASGQEKIVSRIHAINLIAQIGLSLILVPTWGSAGMALIYTLVRAQGVVQLWFVLRKRFAELEFGRMFFGPVLTALAVDLPLCLLLDGISPLTQIAAGIAVTVLYVFIALAMGFIGKRDLALFLRLRRRYPAADQGRHPSSEVGSGGQEENMGEQRVRAGSFSDGSHEC